ncbi:MAG: MBL fold metallo-hydrolase [Myxococcota bacterium]|nr:MBL fold metallo-hydrolase [Myxococcota bacterium]
MAAEARPAGELGQLDRRLLWLIAYGPGHGEGLLVALPERGWLVIDGVSIGSGAAAERPLIAALERWRAPDEPIDALVLTHAHKDHCGGFVELLDHPELGGAIRTIACVAAYVPGARLGAFEVEVTALERLSRVKDDAVERLAAARVRAALERIRSEWERGRATALHEGKELSLSTTRASARVLSPTIADVTTFFAEDGIESRIVQCANDMSAVIDVRFGAMRLLLGADLPEARGGLPLPYGWSAIGKRDASLHEHHALKVPHHASDEAIAAAWHTPAGRARTWVTTPYNGGGGVPSFEEGRGVDTILASDELRLTSLPVAWKNQAPLPEVMTTAQIRSGAHRTVLPGLGTARPAGRARDLRAGDCMWALAFDDRGELVASYRGTAATRVVRPT